MSHIPNSLQNYSPSTGGTVSIRNDIANTIVVLLNTGGTLATLTINMPDAPVSGQIVRIGGSTNVTLLTLAGGTINGAITSIVSNVLGTVYAYNGSVWQRC